MNRLIVGVVLLAGLASAAPAQELRPDLSAIPSDAAGFIHVRVREVWNSEALKPIRQLIENAGPKYIAALDRRFIPAPSQVDRVTMVLEFDSDGEPMPVVIVAIREPLNREQMLRESFPGAKRLKAEDTELYVVEEDFAIHIINDQTLMLGPAKALPKLLDAKRRGNGPLTESLKAAAGARSLTLALNVARMPQELLEELPPPVRGLVRGGVVHLAMEPGAAPVLDARLSFVDAAATDEAEKALKESTDGLREVLGEFRKEAENRLFAPTEGQRSSLEGLPEAAASLAALGVIARIEENLNLLPIKRDGHALVATIRVPPGPFSQAVSVAGLAAGVMLPAVQKVREAAARMRSANNLKQIALALHNYDAANDSLPPAAICDKNGKPLLSWRVAILPYIEQDAVYRQFRLDEPWDSEHNIKFAALRIPVYTHPLDKPSGEHVLTRYQAIVGNNAGWDLKTGLKFQSFLDGMSNTLWIIEAEQGVPWTKPEDLAYDPKAMPPIGFHWGNKRFTQAAFVDGSVRTLSRNIPESTWHLLIQRNDGQPIPNDLDR